MPSVFQTSTTATIVGRSFHSRRAFFNSAKSWGNVWQEEFHCSFYPVEYICKVFLDLSRASHYHSPGLEDDTRTLFWPWGNQTKPLSRWEDFMRHSAWDRFLDKVIRKCQSKRLTEIYLHITICQTSIKAKRNYNRRSYGQSHKESVRMRIVRSLFSTLR